jgi:hypothetical protein
MDSTQTFDIDRDADIRVDAPLDREGSAVSSQLGAFRPYACVAASGLVVDDCVPTRDYLTGGRVVATPAVVGDRFITELVDAERLRAVPSGFK